MFNINAKLEAHNLKVLDMVVEQRGMGSMDGVAVLYMVREGRNAQMRVVPVFKGVSFSFNPITLQDGDLHVDTTSVGPTFEVGSSACLGEAINQFNTFWEEGFEGLNCKISKLHMFK